MFKRLVFQDQQQYISCCLIDSMSRIYYLTDRRYAQIRVINHVEQESSTLCILNRLCSFNQIVPSCSDLLALYQTPHTPAIEHQFFYIVQRYPEKKNSHAVNEPISEFDLIIRKKMPQHNEYTCNEWNVGVSPEFHMNQYTPFPPS